MENKIFSSICAAMADITAIGKDRKNHQPGFKYRGVDDVMNELHGVLAKNKIFIVPEVLEEERGQTQTRNGGNLFTTRLKTKFNFYADDGSCVSAVVIGEAMDSADKASNKALSVAFKYACFQVFCIPTEDEKDPDAFSPKPVIGKDLTGVINNLRDLYSYLNDDMKARAESHIQNGNEKGIIDATNYALRIKSDVDKGL